MHTLIIVISLLAAQPDAGSPRRPYRGYCCSEEVDASDPLADLTLSESEYRIRVAAGAWAGYGSFPAGGVGGPGAAVELGLQVGDQFAFYALAQGGTTVFESLFTVSAMAEYAPSDWFSVASGFGFSGGSGTGLNLWPWFASTPTYRNENYSVGVPVRIAFTIGASQPAGSYRHRFYIAVDGFVGYTFSGNYFAGGALPISGSGGLSLGYQLM